MKKIIVFLVLVFGVNVVVFAEIDTIQSLIEGIKNGKYKTPDETPDEFLLKLKKECLSGNGESCFIFAQKNEKYKSISASYYKKSCNLDYGEGCMKSKQQQKKYWNCILKKMPTIASDRAAIYIREACQGLSSY